MQIIIFILLFVLLFFISRILTRSVSGFLYKFSGSQTFSLHFFHLLFLPGVLVHELSHLITAEVMLVKTSGLNFKLRREGDGVVMGSVGIQKTDPIRRALIGFAPVLVGILIISFSVFLLLSSNSPFSNFVSYFLIFLIVFEVGNTMYSSPKDLDGTLELLAVISIIALILYLLGIRIPSDLINYLNSIDVQNLFSKASLALFITLVVDLLLIIITKAFQSR